MRRVGPARGAASVAGVDGCRGGWLVVTARVQRGAPLRVLSVEIVPSFRAMVRRVESCIAVAVDVPIGLETTRPRRADGEARKILGRPRASSVFPAPVRATLVPRGYRAASAASARASGRRLSRQTFNILPKIREADAVMTPALQSRVVEAHPELSFHALNDGRPLAANKRTRAGQRKRRALLATVIRGPWPARPPGGASLDDLHDACVLAWTAARLSRGEARRVPARPPLDVRGLRMEIVT